MMGKTKHKSKKGKKKDAAKSRNPKYDFHFECSSAEKSTRAAGKIYSILERTLATDGLSVADIEILNMGLNVPDAKVVSAKKDGKNQQIEAPGSSKMERKNQQKGASSPGSSAAGCSEMNDASTGVSSDGTKSVEGDISAAAINEFESNFLADGPLPVSMLSENSIGDSFSSPSISKILGSEDSYEFEVEKGAVASQKSVVKVTEKCAAQVFDKMPESLSAAENSAFVQENEPSRATSATLFNNDTWASKLRGNRSSLVGLKLDDYGQQEEDEIELEDEDLDDVTASFGFVLIGYVAGRNTGYEAITKCCKSWNVKHEIHFHSSGWIVIKFDNEKDREQVLGRGPYAIFGRPFMLKIMPDDFDFSDLEINKVPVWIQFPNLPLSAWNKKALGKISSKIGKPVQTDMVTSTKEKISYARVLVEVDVTKEQKKLLNIRLKNHRFKQHVTYEYVPKYCGKCKAMGHSIDNCRYHKDVAPENPSSEHVYRKKMSYAAVVGQKRSNNRDGLGRNGAKMGANMQQNETAMGTVSGSTSGADLNVVPGTFSGAVSGNVEGTIVQQKHNEEAVSSQGKMQPRRAAAGAANGSSLGAKTGTVMSDKHTNTVAANTVASNTKMIDKKRHNVPNIQQEHKGKATQQHYTTESEDEVVSDAKDSESDEPSSDGIWYNRVRKKTVLVEDDGRKTPPSNRKR